MPRLPTRLAVLLVTVLAAATATARLADGGDDAEAEEAARRVLIVLRILAYDKALASRAEGEQVAVLIVSPPTTEGRAERARWRAGFARLPKVKVGGRSVRVADADFVSEQALDATFATQRPAALIVAGDLAELGAVIRVTRAREVLSFSRDERAVSRGVAIGLVAADERDEIVINLEAARAEGARLAAGLLQLARLVDDETQ